MSRALPGAEGDDSKGARPPRVRSSGIPTARLALALLGAVGALLLLVASFSSIIEITVGTTSKVVDADTAQTGWDRHGPALILLALLALFLLFTGLRASRTALVGLVVAGVAALAIAWIWDRPHIHDTGSVGDIYAEAEADPGTGYYLETLGGALLLFSGGALLALGGRPAPAPAPERTAAPATESAAERAARRRQARESA